MNWTFDQCVKIYLKNSEPLKDENIDICRLKFNNVENFNKMLCTLNKHETWNLARKENSKCLNDLKFFLIPEIFSVAPYEFCSWLLSCSEIKRLQRLCVSTLPKSRLHKTSNQIWSYSFASWHNCHFWMP